MFIGELSVNNGVHAVRLMMRPACLSKSSVLFSLWNKSRQSGFNQFLLIKSKLQADRDKRTR